VLLVGMALVAFALLVELVELVGFVALAFVALAFVALAFVVLGGANTDGMIIVHVQARREEANIPCQELLHCDFIFFPDRGAVIFRLGDMDQRAALDRLGGISRDGRRKGQDGNSDGEENLHDCEYRGKSIKSQ